MHLFFFFFYHLWKQKLAFSRKPTFKTQFIYLKYICLSEDWCNPPPPQCCNSVYVYVKASELHIGLLRSEIDKLKEAAQVGNEMNL